MPIVDLEIVGDGTRGAAQAVADALGDIFGTDPGRTWVRIRSLPADAYAENRSTLAANELPVFVTVLKAEMPEGAALEAEVAAITEAIARIASRPAERVHVAYAPPAAGRQAFGGRLVRRG
jgi:phenylpyruvate tautomerase PptA (4-oxalocrotonate tautomerase family)